MWLGNLLKLVLRLEVCLLQAKGLCSGSDMIFPSTLLRRGLGNKSEDRPSVAEPVEPAFYNSEYCRYHHDRKKTLSVVK